ncbi:Sugar or nucleoside kinase, ribokinase family [Jatrophihabitans endophyticus]|uniref:Sugar or nucleoside kinase, ribokinase family n=1 Tax=Jatrophihabitans endophyticus TaxID=1206085 RepID=A0A1M5C7P4_9ACTN|nr:PfkB family carbohydrate kinase [Jatrophihabitans endophyticus]SHF50745.1 Sugar or nucleoside kinase, ribokinase family [Jatrophihabitans endophyticus]
MHVVCVGDLMVDFVARLPGPIAFGSDTPAAIEVYGGGAAANVAAWLAHAGAQATFVGRIGDDHAGLMAADELTAAGVTPVVEIDPNRATGLCIVLVDERGERSMVPSTGANDAAADVALIPATADWLYVSGYALLGEGPRSFALDALALARERGWSIAVDAASAAPLAAAGAENFLDWIGTDLLLFANHDEARVLTGLDEPSAAAQALALRCGHAVVKRGPLGAVWSDGTGVRSVPAVEVEVFDSTGAGDAFAAGFLAATGEIADCLDQATRLASRAVAHAGARPRPAAS